MAFNKKASTFPSKSGIADIVYERYLPADGSAVRAVIQIAHGMAEHHLRYEPFIDYLTGQGFAVYVNDHVGHGRSVKSDDDLGFFGEKDGHISMVEDMKRLTDIAKEENPGLPVILFGHSMGSFLARLYTERFGSELSAAVYCGTAGPNPAAGVGLLVVKAIMKTKGIRYRSKFIDKLAFGAYNNKTEKRTAFDWLTTDKSIVDAYIADPYCGFLFTAAGYRDLMTLLQAVNRSDWYQHVPKDLPILLIAGKEDPVGAYGKGVQEVYNGLLDSLHTDVTLKLYDGDRHEILNEKDREQVYADVAAFINKAI